MNAIHATKAAHAHGPRTHGAQGAGAANKVAAKGGGGLADLFLGLLSEAMTSEATKTTGETPADGATATTTGDSGDGTNAADPSVLMMEAATATALPVPVAVPVCTDAAESYLADAASADAVAPIVAQVESETVAEALEVADDAPAPAVMATKDDAPEAIDILPKKNAAEVEAPVTPSGNEPQGKAVGLTLETALRKAAEEIGRGAERAFGGRRLDAPSIKSGTENALQAIDGNPTEADAGGFARVAVNAASQHPGGENANGGFTENEAAFFAKAGVKPVGGEKAATEPGAQFDVNTVTPNASPKASAEVAAKPAAPNVPDSVSVRDLGDVVVRSVHYLSGKSDDVVTVRLMPRSLGELQIAVRHSADGVEVVMTAANAAARDALEGHVSGLRDALGRGGVDAPRVTIQVASHFDASHQPSFSQQGHPSGDGHAPRQQQPAAYREPFGSGAREQEPQQQKRQRHDGRLNAWV